MNEILQYGALGILGVLVLFVIPYLVKWLVGFIECQKKEMADISRGFKNTIDNHLNTQAKTMEELAAAIRRLCEMWENGKG